MSCYLYNVCMCMVCHGMSMSIFMSICISVAMTHITGFSSKPSPFLTVGSFFRVSSEFRTQVAIPMTSKKRMTAKSQSYHLKGDQIVTDH